MAFTIDGTNGLTFNNATTQASAGLVAGGTIATGTVTTLTTTTISDGTNSTSSTNCIQGSAKAWVNFSGNGSTTINSSYNVSSVTYNSTGDYTINFTNALTDTNYLPIGAGPSNTTTTSGGLGFVLKCASSISSPSLKSTTQCGMIYAGTGNTVNALNLSVAFFR